jgi:hypothetical protein
MQHLTTSSRCLLWKNGSRFGEGRFRFAHPVLTWSRMDAEIRREQMEQLLPRLQEGISLNHGQQWDEAKAILLDLHNESMMWGGSAFLAWHLSVAADGCRDFALALHAIRWALDADPYPPPFRNSFALVVQHVHEALASLPGESRDVPRLYGLLLKYAEPGAAAHLALARHHLAQGAVEAAGRAIDAALVAEPSNVDAWLVRAAIARRRGKAGDAQDAEVVAGQLEAHVLATTAPKGEA